MCEYLIEFLAKMCHYAQEHLLYKGHEAISESDLAGYMQCTSYQVACFLAQNTVEGEDGVDSNVALDKLCEEPVKSVKEWKKIITIYVKLYGGLRE